MNIRLVPWHRLCVAKENQMTKKIVPAVHQRVLGRPAIKLGEPQKNPRDKKDRWRFTADSGRFFYL
jgi:hypothetical protein